MTRAQLVKKVVSLSGEALEELSQHSNTHIATAALNRLMKQDHEVAGSLVLLSTEPPDRPEGEDDAPEVEAWNAAIEYREVLPGKYPALGKVAGELVRYWSAIKALQAVAKELDGMLRQHTIRKLEDESKTTMTTMAILTATYDSKEDKVEKANLEKELERLTKELEAKKVRSAHLLETLNKPIPQIPTWVRRSIRYADRLVS